MVEGLVGNELQARFENLREGEKLEYKKKRRCNKETVYLDPTF